MLMDMDSHRHSKLLMLASVNLWYWLTRLVRFLTLCVARSPEVHWMCSRHSLRSDVGSKMAQMSPWIS